MNPILAVPSRDLMDLFLGMPNRTLRLVFAFFLPTRLRQSRKEFIRGLDIQGTGMDIYPSAVLKVLPRIQAVGSPEGERVAGRVSRPVGDARKPPVH
jgi:hypothetical protein